MTPARKGDWMQTFSGRAFWPMDPRPEDICIEDIAHALSNECRFSGHCLRYFSVAEHCVLLQRMVPEFLKKAALTHDSPEAYLKDVPRPIKPFLPNYREIERKIEEVIEDKWSIPDLYPAELAEMDTRFLLDEQAQNMSPPPMPWTMQNMKPLGVRLEYWAPEKAEVMFLSAFRETFA